MAKGDYKYSRAHIIIFGRVQGVFLRDSMRREAEKLKVYGWVKNIPDRKVEVVMEGDRNNILKLIEWIKERPFPVRVDNINISWEDYKKEFNNFEIIY